MVWSQLCVVLSPMSTVTEMLSLPGEKESWVTFRNLAGCDWGQFCQDQDIKIYYALEYYLRFITTDQYLYFLNVTHFLILR